MATGKASNRGRSIAISLLFSTALSTAAMVQPAFAADDQAALNVFFNSSYNYCDAKLIGAIWGYDAGRGKIEIGHKIINGIGGNISLMLSDSRNSGNACGWEDTGLSYDDAEKLARVWRMGVPYQAKLKAAQLYTSGRSEMVTRALGGRRQGRRN